MRSSSSSRSCSTAADETLTRILDVVGGRQGGQARRGALRRHRPRPSSSGRGQPPRGLRCPSAAGRDAPADLRLGRGVAQHALIAGKTGSGKSTLLHVLITNLACGIRPTRSSCT
jgi:DNA segregation ATPase FtsK/SpoIIIE, S-DNA-T family